MTTELSQISGRITRITMGKRGAMSRRFTGEAVFGMAAILLASAGSAHATYSIIACDANTRECGVAVETNNLAVGASVPYAQAGVGALVSQFETNPHYGPRGLALLTEGASPEETLRRLLAEDGNFDGAGPEERQVALVSVDGRTATYTGEAAQRAEWVGTRSGLGYSVQGNGLVGPHVVEAMEQAFLKTKGTLAVRLMAALTAGDLAGGQWTGRESAALVARTEDGWPIDIDLRVDHSSDPVGELRKLFDMQSARQQVIEASLVARKGRLEQARSLLIEAVAHAPTWPRVWIRAARVAERIEEPTLALQYITAAFTQNPAWAQAEIGEGDYAELGTSPQFHRWVTAEQEQNAIAAYERLRLVKEAEPERRVQISRMLLEIRHLKEALAVLNDIPQRGDESVDLRLLRSAAYAATEDYQNAIEQCDAALKREPNELRVRLRMAQLEWQARAQKAAK
jgi:uncharacterized Ntn-hydrolase superfamily protein